MLRAFRVLVVISLLSAFAATGVALAEERSLAQALVMSEQLSVSFPIKPSSFYGLVTLSGSSVPDGTVVSAWVRGAKCANVATVLGDGSSWYSIDVPADEAETPEIVEGGTEGEVIVFEIGGIGAEQTAVWHTGTFVRLDLSGQNPSPSLGTVSPDNASCPQEVQRTFTTTYRDPDGWQDVAVARFLINDVLETPGGFYGYYDQNSNEVWLGDDVGEDFIGPQTPGAAGAMLENSFVALDVEGMVVLGSGNELSIEWQVTFKSGFGNKLCSGFLQVSDDLGAVDGWSEVAGPYWVGEYHQPSVGTVLPTRGSIDHDVAQVFTTTSFDPDGSGNLKSVSLLVNDRLSAAGAFYACYDHEQNLVRVINDEGTQMGTARIPGEPGVVLENSCVSLNVESMTITESGSELTITWPVTFKATFGSRSCKAFLYVRDLSAQSDGWTMKADHLWVGDNHPPSLGTASPSQGDILHGQEQVFETSFFDPDGAHNLDSAMVLINDRLDPVGAFYTHYDQDRNLVRLINDAGTQMGAGRTPGEPGAVLANSYVSLNVQNMTITESGNELRITWPVTFKLAFGAKDCRTFVHIRDDWFESDGWTMMADHLRMGSNHPPSVGAIVPNRGDILHGEEQVFETTFSDPDGAHNLDSAMVLINDRLNTLGALYAHYDHDRNLVRLINDAGTQMGAGWTPGEPGVLLQNTYVSLNVQSMTVIESGNELRITWPVTFKPAFGTKDCQAFLHVRDDWFESDGWTMGANHLRVGDNHSPSLGSLVPNHGSVAHGTQQVFTTTFYDPEGAANLDNARMLINVRLGAAGAFYGHYDQDRNLVRLGNDSGTGVGAGFTPGQSGAVLENSYVSLNVEAMTVTASGDELRITWPVTFKSAFGVNRCMLFMYVADDWFESDGWDLMGSPLYVGG